MKLIGDFFSILKTSVTAGGFITTIQLNPAHLIYSSHFPGFPVTPAVVQLQIVHELLESYLGKTLKLVAMPQCKFMMVLNPDETSRLDVHIEFKLNGSQLVVTAYGKDQINTFFKFNSTYQVNELKGE